MESSRREFLAMAALGSASVFLAGCAPAASDPAPTFLAVSPLQIPPLLDAADGVLALVVQDGQAEIRPGTRTATRGVNGPFLGPTLRMRAGQQVAAAVENRLAETTSLHWHGMHLPARYDGGPHQPIAPGETWQPTWTIANRAATLWYHPHIHGATAQQVFQGVAGMILVDDDESDAAGLPSEYGVDDIPCLLMDRTIEADGSMPFDTQPTFGQMGTDVLVDGTLGAYLDLGRTLARFRLLDASNARLYDLAFDDDRSFALVATDQGLLDRPVTLNRLRLGPGERAEIVVAFEPGETVRLRTVAGAEQIDADTLEILEIRVAKDAAPAAALPERLSSPPAVPSSSGRMVREFALQGHDAINGAGMDMTRIDEVVPAGAIEVWRVRNTVYSHNFHIHGCRFAVLARDGQAPEAWETGWKDTVHLPDHADVELLAVFGDDVDPRSPYMYHCHILRHEDSGMMGQFVVVEPGTEASVSRTLPAM